MTSTEYNPAADAGRVRLLIDDASAEPVFTDAEIQAFLDMANGNVLRAAARALLMIAGSEARLGKKIRTQDLSTDGPAVAAELRALAKQLRAEADEEEAASGDASFFDVIEYPYGQGRHPELTERPRW